MKKPKSKFGIGRASIEARFYIVRGYYESTQRTDEHGKPVPMDVLRIGADNINDLMEHMYNWKGRLLEIVEKFKKQLPPKT